MPHNISALVAPTHNNIRLPMCLSLPDADTQRRITGIKIGAISRTSPSSHPPTICVGPWGKFVRVSNVYLRMHVEVQALHYMEWYVQKCMLLRGTPTCHSE